MVQLLGQGKRNLFPGPCAFMGPSAAVPLPMDKESVSPRGQAQLDGQEIAKG